ncbi:hypothetical protein FHR23_000079 [Stakelama sediminis]|uniref:Uncharacterized protein n=1 Tax=Stakelama sediminis TaxID=463200 RepID=A0A840YUA7_9SPHN|nr:hypothetical protein [Stakelama sediminis]
MGQRTAHIGTTFGYVKRFDATPFQSEEDL